MSGKSNCYDNATVLTFFRTIRDELIWHEAWETRGHVYITIFDYIQDFYNPRRRH